MADAGGVVVGGVSGGGAGSAPGRRTLLLVALVAIVARAAAAAVTEPSDDLKGWRWVDAVLAAGGNPYQETPRLNWPPLWMLWIGAAGSIARLTALPFDALVRVLPFAADAATAALLVRLSLPLGVAFALHPVGLAITGGQAQFDAVPALLATVAVLAVATGIRSRDLIAGVALGIGAGFKTWPAFLAPALALRLRTYPERGRLLLIALGLPALLLVPVAVLAPEGFRDHVLAYSSAPGYWGLTGLGVLLGSEPARQVAAFAARHGRLLVVGAMALAWAAAARLPARAAAAATLLAFLAATPGFGPQYLLWLAPLALLVPGRLPLAWSAAASLLLAIEAFVLPRLHLGAGLTHTEAALLTVRLVNLLRAPVWLIGIAWLVALLVQALRSAGRAPVGAGGRHADPTPAGIPGGASGRVERDGPNRPAHGRGRTGPADRYGPN